MSLISYVSSDIEPAAGTEYSLKLINQSSRAWTFFVYQQCVDQTPDMFSLAWFASPYKIRQGDAITFRWQIDYVFVWSDTGVLRPGISFDASGNKPADPNGKNTTQFDLSPGPGLSDPVQAPPVGSLVIHDGDDVPNGRFSVGIGMSGQGTFAVQAGTGLNHMFTPTPSYWIAAGDDIQVGTVLNIKTVTDTAEVKFPSAVNNLVATLGDDNRWTIRSA